MTTVIDLTYTYTTRYTQYDEKSELTYRKLSRSMGSGKKIRIDSLKCSRS